MVALALTGAHLRQMAHDALELGLVLFNRVNAIVFAVVVLALPVFAALGPLWLLAYLFALSWAYLGRLQLVAAAGLLRTARPRWAPRWRSGNRRLSDCRR